MISARAEAEYLSSQLHCAVRLPKRLERHLLYIRRKGSDPKVELSAFAAALRAQVRSEAGICELVRTAEDDRKLEDEWAAERAKWIEERVKRAEKYRRDHRVDEDPAKGLQLAAAAFAKAIDSFGTPAQSAAIFEANTNQLGPAGRLMVDAIRTVGVSALARLRVDSSTIFETEPRGGARPLPQFRPALQRYEDVLGQLQSFKPSPEMAGSLDITGMSASLGQPGASPVTARLSVAGGEGAMLLGIEAFGADGNLLARGNFPISARNVFTSPDAVAKVAMRENPRSAKVPVPRELLSLSGDRTEAGIPAWIEKPVDYEPLSVDASFAMDALVGPSAPCAVVDMTDALAVDAPLCLDSGQLNVDAFRKVMDAFHPYERVEGEGFVALRPVNPFAPPCLDRRALQRWVRSVLAAKYVDLRQLAVTGEPKNRLLLRYLSILRPLTIPNVDGSGPNLPPFALMKFIGAIDDSAWSALIAGRTLTVGHLGITKDLLDLFDDQGISPDAKELPARFQHPAELYQDGKFDLTPVRIVTKSEPVFRFADASRRGWSSWEPQSLGIYQLQGLIKPGYGENARAPFEAECNSKFRFQIGTRNQARFQVGLPAGNTITCPLPRPIDGVSPEIPYSRLPQDLRDRTWEMMRRALLRTGGHPDSAVRVCTD